MKINLKYGLVVGLCIANSGYLTGQENTTGTNPALGKSADDLLEEIRRSIAEGDAKAADGSTNASESESSSQGGASDYGGSGSGVGGYASGSMGGYDDSAIRSPIELAKMHLAIRLAELRPLLESDSLAPEQKEAVQRKLKQVLTEYFQEDMVARVREFDSVKSKLLAMEEKLKSRVQQKDEIIDFQLKQFLFKNEGLEIGLLSSNSGGYGGYGGASGYAAPGGYSNGGYPGSGYPGSGYPGSGYPGGTPMIGIASTDSAGGPTMAGGKLDDEALRLRMGYDVGFRQTGVLRQSSTELQAFDPVRDYRETVVSPEHSDSDVKSMKLIILAFHLFDERFKHLPRSENRLVESDPPHSWRVAILPLIGHGELYRQYRFNEPWDSPANQAVASQMPEIYGRQKGNESNRTSYLTLVGNGAWDSGNRPATFGDITDGSSNTIMLIDSATDVVWTEPQDFDFDPTGELPQLNSSRLIGLMDGVVGRMKEEAFRDASTFKGLITRSGGEVSNWSMEDAKD